VNNFWNKTTYNLKHNLTNLFILTQEQASIAICDDQFWEEIYLHKVEQSKEEVIIEDNNTNNMVNYV